jgi:hypothetical protein
MFAGQASAALLTIPDAHYELSISLDGTILPSLGIGSTASTYLTAGGDITLGGGSETSSAIMNAPDMTISGNSYGGPSAYVASAMGIIQYYYAVFGPARVSVPMLISASVSTSVLGGVSGTVAGVSGLVTWDTDNLGTRVIRACSALSGASCGLLSASASVVDDPFFVTSNPGAPYGIILRLDGSTGPSILTSYFSGSVDPLVSIDPTWLLDHPDYRLVFSSNIAAETAPVPEPPTSTLLLTGLGLIGVFACRRKVTHPPKLSG